MAALPISAFVLADVWASQRQTQLRLRASHSFQLLCFNSALTFSARVLTFLPLGTTPGHRVPCTAHSPPRIPAPSLPPALQLSQSSAPTPGPLCPAAASRAALYQQPRANQWLQPRHSPLRHMHTLCPRQPTGCASSHLQSVLFFFFYN